MASTIVVPEPLISAATEVVRLYVIAPSWLGLHLIGRLKEHLGNFRYDEVKAKAHWWVQTLIHVILDVDIEVLNMSGRHLPKLLINTLHSWETLPLLFICRTSVIINSKVVSLKFSQHLLTTSLGLDEGNCFTYSYHLLAYSLAFKSKERLLSLSCICAILRFQRYNLIRNL
jgi:hypothetical protein